jgi:hypothetical protein
VAAPGSPAAIAATHAAVAAAAASAARMTQKLKIEEGKLSDQIPGVALAAAADHLLGAPGPTGEIVLWTLVILAAFGLVPLGFSMIRRRRSAIPAGQPGPVTE